jgi:hypothetical protein
MTHDWINHALNLLSLQFKESEVVSRLVSEGCDAAIAEKLVAFLPLACGRRVIVGVSFPPLYRVMGEDHLVRGPFKLSSELWWRNVETFLDARGESMADAIDTVGRRSSEFDAVNKALAKGSRLSDLVAAEPIFFFVQPGE